METFPIPYFVLSERYPESSTKVQFGGGYEFASAPKAPDQIVFVLRMNGMIFFLSDPDTLDTTTNAEFNMGALIEFYEDHRLHVPFEFEHPFRGTVVCRFDEPLQYKVVEGGRGLVEPFELKLRLLP